jgi:predicted RNase H-like nuclease (RuvC/YqgF family)
MLGKRLLVVGIDPGMTTAYALLDISGNFVLSRSAKELDLKQLLTEIHSQGKVIAVGTDKAKVPGLVQEFVAKTGAKVLSPREDMRVLEKKTVTSSFNVHDAHEMDALAAALYAYNELKPLILKVEKFCDAEHKGYLKERIIEIVMRKGMSIKDAAIELERKPVKVEKEEVKQDNVLSKKTILEREQRMKDLEQQLSILRQQASQLRNQMQRMRQPKLIVKKDMSEEMMKREEHLKQVRQLARKKEEDKAIWMRKAQQLEQFLAKTQSHYILKKLDNLGSEEFRRKQFLGIQKDDILLVTDPNSMSMSTVDEVRKHVSVIIHKVPISERVRAMLPFIFIDANKLQVKETENFAIVQKKELDALKSAKRQLSSIIEEYKKERATLSHHNQP